MSKSNFIFGGGFIGSAIHRHFKSKDIPTSLFVKKHLDYTSEFELTKTLESVKDQINCVINCSGYTGSPNVDACEKWENQPTCWKLNVLDPLLMVRTCNKLDIPVVHVGSGCIYTGYQKDFTEDDAPNFGNRHIESSYYSRCKHAFEILSEPDQRYVLRIRIPFTGDNSPKNYFSKLLKYDNLINELNSVTSVTDFCSFVEKFVKDIRSIPTGIYNVTNTQPVKAEQVVEILKKNGLSNPNWKFIEVKDLNTVANRSNCVLNTDKIKALGLELPDTLESIERDAKLMGRLFSNQIV